MGPGLQYCNVGTTRFWALKSSSAVEAELHSCRPGPFLAVTIVGSVAVTSAQPCIPSNQASGPRYNC